VTVMWEEVVFRGFLLTRLRAIFRTWWLAVPIGSLLFAAAHLYEGVLAVVVIGWLAFAMAILFVWRRSLVPCLVLHWLHNVGAILLLKAISTTWR
jgi:membrane protease YdiL (CAAX protease family)